MTVATTAATSAVTARTRPATNASAGTGAGRLEAGLVRVETAVTELDLLTDTTV